METDSKYTFYFIYINIMALAKNISDLYLKMLLLISILLFLKKTKYITYKNDRNLATHGLPDLSITQDTS